MTIVEALSSLPPEMRIMCHADVGNPIRTVAEELAVQSKRKDPTDVWLSDQKYNYGQTILKAVVCSAGTLYRENRP